MKLKSYEDRITSLFMKMTIFMSKELIILKMEHTKGNNIMYHYVHLALLDIVEAECLIN